MNSTPHDKEQLITPIAIVGLGGVFPGAPNVMSLWDQVLKSCDSTTEVPAHRWPPEYFDPSSKSPHRFYSRRGGFIDDLAYFDALRFGVMPRSVEGAEPDQLMTLQTCAAALEDAGYAPKKSEVGHRGRDFDRVQTQVIIGRGGYIGPAMNSLNQRVRSTEQFIRFARDRGWLRNDQVEELREEFIKELRPFGPDTAIGLVPNLCASRVADRLGLGGAAYTVDAACASALVAVSHGCEALNRGQASLVLAGGVHMVHDLTFWSVFTQLGALSRQQRLSAFSATADGLLIGEGVGIIALKRLDDAIQDGDRVYAVIRGIGVSSDAGQASLMSPDPLGQARAMESAWRGLDKSKVSMIEAHGTGTPTGDEVELRSTHHVFGSEGLAIGIGSIKSNIGHTMPAAGAAGLIKAALSVYHGIKAPSLYLEDPHPLFKELSEQDEKCEDKKGRLYPLQKKELWNDQDRWAGVSAFGFGGINAHLAISNGPQYSPLRPPISRTAEPRMILGVAAAHSEELASRLEALAEAPPQCSVVIGEGPARAALIDPHPEMLREAAELLRSGKTRQGRRGIWLSEKGLLYGASSERLALMFPGIEASFSPRIDDLCARLGVSSPTLYPPLDLGERGVSVIRLGMALDRCFSTFGLEVKQLCGHSIGEWSALICGGYFLESDVEPFIAGLDPSGLKVPEVAFLATGCSKERAEDLLKAKLGNDLTAHHIYCSHDNCPHQSIFCIPLSSVASITEFFQSAGVIAHELPFRSGFHAPHFEPYAKEMDRHLRSLHLRTAQRTLWSATTLGPYPENPEDFYTLGGQHLVQTVRFRELIERLYQEGVRVFVQMGVGSLSSFVSDTLRGRPHRVVDAHSERQSAWSQWLHLAGTLFAEGAVISFDRLSHPGALSNRAIQLDLSATLLHINPTVDPVRPSDVGAHLGEASYPRRLSPTQQNDMEQETGLVYEAQWTLSLKHFPFLIDHCFFRQPPDWSHTIDRFPVVPMTLSIQWVMEAAQQIADERSSGLRVVGVEDVRAAKWIELEPENQVTVQATWLSKQVIRVELRGHLSAKVLLEEESVFSTTIAPQHKWEPLEGERSSPLKGEEIYAQRWMFHGPAYHGISSLVGIGPQGIRGILINKGTPGALFDNVGQLFGLWVMLTQREDRVVMPVRLESLKLYGPPPPMGALLSCTAWIDRLERREVCAHMTLWHDGKVWAICEGWSDWRFETSGTLWSLMRYPERALFSQPMLSSAGITLTLAEGISGAASSREFLVGRCLNSPERNEYRALKPKQQRDWLAGRIASKDALRAALWAEGGAPIYPLEVALTCRKENTAPHFDLEPLSLLLQKHSASEELRSRPHLIRLSISHVNGIAVAAVSLPTRGKSQARAIGVDLALVIPRELSWRELSFKTEELERLSSLPKDRHAEALTIWWVIKEAGAKRLAQLGEVSGLGSPSQWLIKEWSSTGALSLDPSFHSLSSGCALLLHPSSKHECRVMWWLFERGGQRWSCALSV